MARYNIPTTCLDLSAFSQRDLRIVCSLELDELYAKVKEDAVDFYQYDDDLWVFCASIQRITAPNVFALSKPKRSSICVLQSRLYRKS